MPTHYLDTRGEFEKLITRSGIWHPFSFRSPRLDTLIADIDAYIASAGAVGPQVDRKLRAVATALTRWESNDPKEFADRCGKVHKDEFNLELDAAFLARGLAEEPGDLQLVNDQFPPPPRAVINRHREIKRTAQITAGLGGVAITGAQFATGTGAIALATGAAGAVSATGIGLVVAGAVVTVASVGLAATSAVKTHRHLLKLEDLYERRNQFLGSCYEVAFIGHGAKPGIRQQTVWSQRTHNFIADQILPFIIVKKGSKFKRKCVASVPIAGGLLTNSYAIGRKIFKVVTRTAGVQRYTAAYWLAEHFCRCSCPFVDDIVSSLYSVDEMNWLHERCDYHEIAGFLADKMKST